MIFGTIALFVIVEIIAVTIQNQFETGFSIDTNFVMKGQDKFQSIRDIYSKGRNDNKNIPLNNIDCQLLLQEHNYGRYSCDDILNNDCYKNVGNCYTTLNSIPNNITKQISFSTVQTSGFKDITFVLFIIYIFNIITFHQCCSARMYTSNNGCEGPNRGIFGATKCSMCSASSISGLFYGLVLIPCILMVIIILIILLPFISISVNDYFFHDIKLISNYATDIVTFDKITFTTKKPTNLQNYVFDGCTDNNWIETSTKLPNCHDYYGLNLCCIEPNYVQYTESALSLMKYQNAVYETQKVDPYSYKKLIDSCAFAGEIIAYYLQPFEVIVTIIICVILCYKYAKNVSTPMQN